MYHLWVVTLFADIYSCCWYFLPPNVSRHLACQEGLSRLRLGHIFLLWEAVLPFWISQLFIKRQCDFASPQEYICLTDSPQRCWKQIYLPVLIVVLGLLAASCSWKNTAKLSQEGLWADRSRLQKHAARKAAQSAWSGSLGDEALNCHSWCHSESLAPWRRKRIIEYDQHGL